MQKLKVILLEAKNIPKVDVVGWADPYCLLQVDGTKVKRSETKKGKEPIWDERFKFKIKDKATNKLYILLKDHDALNKDDEIGRVVLPLAPLQPGQAYLQWVKLVPTKGVEDTDCQIRIILEVV
jgi:Ca2+-dependent lipid-binding protein